MCLSVPLLLDCLIMQRRYCVASCLLLCLTYPCFAIWPAPRSITTGQQTLLLSSQFSIVSALKNTPDDLSQAISRTHSRLLSDNLGRLVVGRGSSDSPSLQSAHALSTLRLSLTSGASVRSISDESIMSLGERSEGYTLLVPASGAEAVITADSTLGIFRGLSTFEQLWYAVDGRVYAVGMPLNVVDEPVYVRISLLPLLE